MPRWLPWERSVWIRKSKPNKEHKKCKHILGNSCCLFSTVPPEPMFERWNHTQHGAARLDCSRLLVLLLTVVAVGWFFFFLFIYNFLFIFFSSPPPLRKEPYWNPRWQKACLPLLHLTHHRIHWTGLYLYCIKLLRYIYIFFLIDTKKLP